MEKERILGWFWYQTDWVWIRNHCYPWIYERFAVIIWNEKLKTRVDVELEKSNCLYTWIYGQKTQRYFMASIIELCLTLNSIKNWMALGFLCYSGLCSKASFSEALIYCWKNRASLSLPITFSYFFLYSNGTKCYWFICALLVSPLK